MDSHLPSKPFGNGPVGGAAGLNNSSTGVWGIFKHLEMDERPPGHTEDGKAAAELLKRFKEEEERRRSEEIDGEPEEKLLYSVDENPPWYTCIALGLQVRGLTTTYHGTHA